LHSYSTVLGCDFNVKPTAWTLGQTTGGAWWWFDEIRIKNTHTAECAQELVAKIKKCKAAGHKARPAVIICGDASGKSRKTSAVGETDYSLIKVALKEAGITFTDKTPDANPGVKDRVNTVNSKCRAANGDVRLYLHPKNCPQGKRDLERTTWKEGSSAILEDKKDKERTHSSDSMGYPITILTPIKGVNVVGKVSVISRAF